MLHQRNARGAYDHRSCRRLLLCIAATTNDVQTSLDMEAH